MSSAISAFSVILLIFKCKNKMKIGVVGTGFVGTCSAYACLMNGLGSEIVLVDKDKARAIAEAQDILHATPFTHSISVRAGDYDALKDAKIVIIAAGVGQRPGESRLDLLKRNAMVFEQIIPAILEQSPEAILLIASNPVDVMTHIASSIAMRHCNLASSKVIGSGTILDTARFRTLLAEHLNISPHSVHANVLGEHGDSEVLIWSNVYVSNLPLEEFARQLGKPITKEIRSEIDDGVRNAAYKIIEGKGATCYGIGAGMARIVKAILNNQQAVLTCCSVVESFEEINNATFALPRIIGSSGIEGTIAPVLSKTEKQDLIASVKLLKEIIDAVDNRSSHS